MSIIYIHNRHIAENYGVQFNKINNDEGVINTKSKVWKVKK